MKFLENFSERYPDDTEVNFWEEYIQRKYGDRIFDTEFGKMVQVDDKSYFLNQKSEIVDRIFYDVKRVSRVIHEPSLRRAIKNWIDKTNI